MQKVRCHFIFFKTSTAYRITNSSLFHFVIQRTISTFPLQYFSLSLNLLYLALEDGSPIFQQVFSHCTYFLNKNFSYFTGLNTFFGNYFILNNYYKNN
jgi:hypothetical protein